jgi:hypothetical protein
MRGRRCGKVCAIQDWMMVDSRRSEEGEVEEEEGGARCAGRWVWCRYCGVGPGQARRGSATGRAATGHRPRADGGDRMDPTAAGNGRLGAGAGARGKSYRLERARRGCGGGWRCAHTSSLLAIADPHRLPSCPAASLPRRRLPSSANLINKSNNNHLYGISPESKKNGMWRSLYQLLKQVGKSLLE